MAIFLDKYGNNLSNDDWNSYAWEICQLSTVNKELEIAAKGMARVVKIETDSSNLLPAAVDTYANLLYRLGKKEQAIQEEERALYYAINYEKGRMIDEFKLTLQKMKNAETIWPAKNN